jgi:hypothetical protein
MNINLAEETSMSLTGDWTSPEAERLSKAWFDAIAMDHKLPDNIRYMEGMSGRKYRYLINNLIAATTDARYLEIGSYLGSTACSAMYGNKAKVTCIDNFSDHYFLGKSPKEGFFKNTDSARNDDIDFTFIESDFRKVDVHSLGKHNIYMFDGPHNKQDQIDGITMFQDALDDVYTLIVDDWNGANERDGTKEALDALGHTILARIDIITRWDGKHPDLCFSGSDWHNGYLLAVVSKK